ncbi:MAG TPA: hypothetical protein VGL24_01025 [Chthoniobacterales bacterium]|jgi:hypothetical protein
MPSRKPINRIAPRVPPVKYFSILHGAALMVGTAPGPSGDDFGRKWTMLNQAGQIMPAPNMAARYFLFGESGCEQVGAKSAAKMAAQFGSSIEALVTGEKWRPPKPKTVAPKKKPAATTRRTSVRSRKSGPNPRRD